MKLAMPVIKTQLENASWLLPSLLGTSAPKLPGIQGVAPPGSEIRDFCPGGSFDLVVESESSHSLIYHRFVTLVTIHLTLVSHLLAQ